MRHEQTGDNFGYTIVTQTTIATKSARTAPIARPSSFFLNSCLQALVNFVYLRKLSFSKCMLGHVTEGAELCPATRACDKKSLLITHVTDCKGHDRRYAIDAGKIFEELGFIPNHIVKTGIQETLNWILNNPKPNNELGL